MARVSHGDEAMDDTTTPPRLPPDLWEEVCGAAERRGLDPRILLRWLLSHAIAGLPRIEAMEDDSL